MQEGILSRDDLMTIEAAARCFRPQARPGLTRRCIRPQEGGDTGRVPLVSSTGGENVKGFLLPIAFTVWAVHRHRAEGIGDSHNAREQRRLFTGKAVRIAAPIPLLMVMPDAVEGVLEARHGSHNDCAHHRVLLNCLELFRGQMAGLSENAVGDADLADIVVWET